MDLALCSHKKGWSWTWSSVPLSTKTTVSNSPANQNSTGSPYVLFIVSCMRKGNGKLSTMMRCFLESTFLNPMARGNWTVSFSLSEFSDCCVEGQASTHLWSSPIHWFGFGIQQSATALALKFPSLIMKSWRRGRLLCHPGCSPLLFPVMVKSASVLLQADCSLDR